jgi:hypothetical protein
MTIVKLASLDLHLADLCLAFERMCWHGLKVNPLKYVFGVSTDKFLKFIIHEHDIEIDKKAKPIKKVQAPVCKKRLQNFLDKLNWQASDKIDQ